MILYADIQRLQKLLTDIEQNKYSDFYKVRFADFFKKKKQIDQEILNSLPFLTRQDITSTHPDDRLHIDKHDVEFISYTSGTSDGKPLIQYWSHVENYYYDPSLGLDIQTPLILHPALNKNFGHTFIRQCRESKKKLTPVFADYQNLEQSAIIAKSTLIDSIYTTPTLAEHIALPLSKQYDVKSIKLLVLFSETLTSQKKDILKRLYPNAKIANVYASSEVGQILLFPTTDEITAGIEQMHILKEAVIAVELIDGELVVTMNQNKAFPLIRYRTGDYFKIIDSDTLVWEGRDDIDKIKVNGLEIRVEDIEKALSYCTNEIGNAYQIHFYSEISTDTQREILKIKVEVVKNFSTIFAKQEAEEKIKQTLLDMWFFTSTANLQTAVDKKLVLPPQIVFVDKVSLQTTKTRRIVSHI